MTSTRNAFKQLSWPLLVSVLCFTCSWWRHDLETFSALVTLYNYCHTKFHLRTGNGTCFELMKMHDFTSYVFRKTAYFTDIYWDWIKNMLNSVRCYHTCWCLGNAMCQHFDGLVPDCSNSSVLAMELLQYCTKPSTSWVVVLTHWGLNMMAEILQEIFSNDGKTTLVMTMTRLLLSTRPLPELMMTTRLTGAYFF